MYRRLVLRGSGLSFDEKGLPHLQTPLNLQCRVISPLSAAPHSHVPPRPIVLLTSLSREARRNWALSMKRSCPREKEMYFSVLLGMLFSL